MRCVTSFSEEGYEQYGKRFLTTYLEHVGVPIDVYTEGGFVPDITHKLITYRPLEEAVGCVEFMALADFPAARGDIWGEGKRNYRFDCFKFSRKCFAQIDAASREPGRLYWLDADIEFSAKFTLPEFDGFMCYLGRSEWHSCASLVGFDTSHEVSGEFFKRYWLLHVTGTIFALPEWHDSFVLDWLRLESQAPATNLAEGLDLKGPANVFDAVFSAAHHKKGNIKKFQNRYEELLHMVAKERPERILEIGTWNGNRAIEMCQFGAEYVGFDLFEEATDETDAEEMNVKAHHNVGDVREKLIEAGVVANLIPGNTNETLPAYRENSGGCPFDFAFIDGGHSIETIQSDWNTVRHLMKPGGLVVFDDYYEGPIDTDKFGANKVVEMLPHELGSRADPVVGGGKTRLAMVRV